MEQMNLDELMNYWEEKARDIASDESLNYKERYYEFIDAYTTYLFYRNAVDEFYEEAQDVAIGWGLSKGIFD